MMNKRNLLRATALAVSSLLLAGTASAQDFPPKKPVTLVVGFAAGGAADAAARLIAKKLGENIGQTVVVDNKGGAGGNIAHQFVANAAPDGSVLLLGSVGPLTIAPHLMKLTYDPSRTWRPSRAASTSPTCWWCTRLRVPRRWPSSSSCPKRNLAAWNLPPPARARPRTWQASCSTSVQPST